MAIDVEVNISKRITPELIEQLKTENTEYNYLTLDREKLDKLQAIISFIFNNENYYRDCLLGAITFKLTSQGFDDALEDPEIVDHTIVKAAAELGAEYETFAKQLYKAEENEADDKIEADSDVDGLVEGQVENGAKETGILYMHNTGEAKMEMSEEERNMLRALLQACLLEPEITDTKVITVPGQVMHIQ
ncbi:MAG: hypothetical protein QG657_4781 [Acidobacteriota bacterium]|nr:hypothetical protein [Acidobacteriota bacterium]